MSSSSAREIAVVADLHLSAIDLMNASVGRLMHGQMGLLIAFISIRPLVFLV